MARFIALKTCSDSRGTLTVLEKVLPFEIKRIFYIYDVKEARGGHAHKQTQLAMICLGGRCEIIIRDGQQDMTYCLDKPNQCLLLEPHEWHIMQKFSHNAILLVLASDYYDPDDYIYEVQE